ncbi:unknown [Firmicutes bacterium CAG:449]|nr:unknown [Firmicutes bacterium CAG:449]
MKKLILLLLPLMFLVGCQNTNTSDTTTENVTTSQTTTSETETSVKLPAI